MKDKTKTALKCFAQVAKQRVRAFALKRKGIHSFLSYSLTYRKFIGGLWAHYFVEDGQVSIWDYIPEGANPFEVIAPYHHALHFHNYDQPLY